jgi:hypothetical protein
VRIDGSNRRVGWNLKENKHVEYAYAMTSHSSQGATVDRVLVHIDTGDSRNRALINQTLGYVALSRAAARCGDIYRQRSEPRESSFAITGKLDCAGTCRNPSERP